MTTQLCAERSQKERKKASASTQESKNNNNDNDNNDLDTNNASSCMLSSIPHSFSANIFLNINTQSIQDQDDETPDTFPL